MGFKFSFRSLRYLAHRLLKRRTTHLDGMRLFCDPEKVNRAMAREIIKGRYELAERKLAREAIQSGDRVLEIGAGLGVVSILCTRLAGVGNVTSYEANTALEAPIRENFALNDLIPNLVLKAVTVDGQPITFFQNDNVVSSSVYDRGLVAERITVPSVAIDTAIAETDASVIVMDVEGAEVDLLPAADLRAVREIIVEVHPHIVGAPAIDGMISALTERGFAVTERLHKTVWLSRIAAA